MHVGVVAHRVQNGVCMPSTITAVVRDQDGENVNGKVRFGHASGAPEGEHSEDKYFEGTWHTAESCTRDENFVERKLKTKK